MVLASPTNPNRVGKCLPPQAHCPEDDDDCRTRYEHDGCMYLCPTGSASCDPNACVVNNNIIRAFIFVFLLTMHGGVACSSYIRSWIYTVDRCLLLSICSIQKYAHDRYVSFMSLVSITLLFDHTFIQIRLRLVNLSHESRAILKWTFRASEISRNIWRSS